MKITFYAKIGMMIVALAGVFYGMRRLDSGDVGRKLSAPDSTLGVLLGSNEKITNWCPPETVEVELYSEDGSLLKGFSAPVDISSFCEIMVGSFDNAEVDEKAYGKRLAAKSKAGDVKVLEQISGKPIFRVQGLPFKSDMLLKNIANRVKP
jgi:hypothetical protein